MSTSSSPSTPLNLVKAFGDANINIQGTWEKPLFQANQVGKLLGLTNIRMSMQGFDDTQKCVRTTYTNRGERDTTFLTEQGLYALVFRSNREEAEVFRKWVADVITEIRLTGKYELEHRLEMVTAEAETQRVLALEEGIMSQLDGEKCVYIGNLGTIDGKPFFKFGYTDDVKSRSRAHKCDYPNGFHLLFAEKHENYIKLESAVKNHPAMKQRQQTIVVRGNNKTECYVLDGSFTVKHVIKIIKESGAKLRSEEDKRRQHEQYMKDLLLEREKTKQKEEETKQKELDLKLEEMRWRMRNGSDLPQSVTDSSSTSSVRQASPSRIPVPTSEVVTPGLPVLISNPTPALNPKNSNPWTTTQRRNIMQKFVDDCCRRVVNSKVQSSRLYRAFEMFFSTQVSPDIEFTDVFTQTCFTLMMKTCSTFKTQRSAAGIFWLDLEVLEPRVIYGQPPVPV